MTNWKCASEELPVDDAYYLIYDSTSSDYYVAAFQVSTIGSYTYLSINRQCRYKVLMWISQKFWIKFSGVNSLNRHLS